MEKISPIWKSLIVDEDKCAELLSELVKIPSLSGNEKAVQEYIFNWFVERSIPVKYQVVEDGLINVVAEVNGISSGPTLLLCGHTDTALPVDGWDTEPFIPTRIKNKLYGLGAMDMKSGIATAMLTVEALANCKSLWNGTIIFAAVSDEEAYSRGARGLIKEGIHADAAILCEPEFVHPQLGAVGKVLVKVEVKGKAAHGSFPEKGVNAVVEAGKLLALLDNLEMGNHPQIGSGSQCVLGIMGGPKEYVIQVPEVCEFTINRHIIPGETSETVLQQVQELIDKLESPAQFLVSVQPPYYPPFATDIQTPIVQVFMKAFEKVIGYVPNFSFSRGVCDGNYLSNDAKIPTLVFGPSGQNLHSSNEWADLSQMPKAMEVYLETIFTFMDNAKENAQL